MIKKIFLLSLTIPIFFFLVGNGQLISHYVAFAQPTPPSQPSPPKQPTPPPQPTAPKQPTPPPQPTPPKSPFATPTPTPTPKPAMPEGGIDFQSIMNQAMPTFKFKEAKIGDIISALLPYLFVLAGLMLFVYLILGGFQLMTSGGDPKAMESAKGKITNAVVGFIIVFIAYWLVQILQVVFGLPKIF